MQLTSMQYLPRTLEKTVRSASKAYKVIMVSGLRQVGKSTMLRHLCSSDRQYVTLDDPTAAGAASSAPALFFRRFRAPHLIDEIQLAPQLFPALKMTVDDSDDKGQFWITGSQRLALMSSVSDKLPGRLVSFDLLPMSIYERNGLGLQQRPFIPSADLLDSLSPLPSQNSAQTWKIIWQGAWPDVLNKEAQDREWFFRSMLDFYIGKDVMVLNGIQNRLQFMKFMKALALTSGKELNMSSLGEIAEISQPTVRRWLSIAEASGLIYLIRPYYANIKKQLVKTPKVIMADTGLIAFLLSLKSPEEMAEHMNSGAFFETFCIMEILKSWVHNGEIPDFYYYRDSQGVEVDLLIKYKGTYWPVEIKSTEEPGRKHSKWIEKFQKINSEAGIPVGLGSVVAMNRDTYPITDSVIAHSIWAI